MKLVKSLLLGSAAGIAAVAGAQAADLPSRKAAPVEYVRVCSTYGAGFFYIPGTETCLRVGGRIRAEYLVAERYTSNQDGYGFRARGRLNIDARTATAYGTLRTFIRFEMSNSNGAYAGGAHSGTAFTGMARGAVQSAGNGLSSVYLDKGFIQFGPITAGRAQSFFDFYADDLNDGVIRGSDLTTNLLAYTAPFGGGFSATLSLEDRSEREVSPAGVAVSQGLVAIPKGVYVAGGQTMPDIVGALNITQGWGSAQLSGAFIQRNVALGLNNSGDTDYGFAVQAGVKINLPMLAAGDVFWLQAAYAEGGISYLGYGGTGTGSTWGPNSRAARVNVVNADAAIDSLGRVKLTKGYAVTAGLLRYWTPTIRQGVYGSYSQLDYANTVSNLDPKEIRVGTNLIWSPVAGLDIGVEVLYARVEVKNRMISAADVSNFARPVKSDDTFQGRLRIQCDF